MVAPRKEKNQLTFLPKNLKFLRKKKDATLLELSKELLLKGKTSYLAYEEGRAVPDIFKLSKLATYFDVSLEELIYKDLTLVVDTPSVLNNENQYELEIVPFAAAAGYAKGFGDTDVKELEKIKIPIKPPHGISRVFEINGDSMEPIIPNGSKVIAIRISVAEIRRSKQYIIVTYDGRQCKSNELSEDQKITYLISENKEHKMKHINTEDIKELWEVWKIF